MWSFNVERCAAILVLLINIMCLSSGLVTGGNHGWTCAVDGKMYHEGDNFTTSLSGPCITYQCKGGFVQTIKLGCTRSGHCVDVNVTWTTGCMTYQCQETRGSIGIRLIDGGCMAQGKCLPADAVYTNGCFHYSCIKHTHGVHFSFRLILKEWGCSYGAKCVPANYTESYNCMTRSCQMRSGSVGMYTISEACHSPSNTCVKVGESHTHKCLTAVCKKQNLMGMNMFVLDPSTAKCRGSDGKCHGEGETFSMSMNGDVMTGCTCKISGLNAHYSCANHV